MNKVAMGICGLLVAVATAHAADDPAFDRVRPNVYGEMLHGASKAYDHKDYAQAFELNQRAACAGDKTSQAILGRMYLLGQGTTRDDIAGYAWIRIAADFSFADFTSLARKLEAAMSPEQRTKGNAKADALRKNYGMAVTNMSCHGESQHGVYMIDSVICTPDVDGGEMLLRRCVAAAAK